MTTALALLSIVCVTALVAVVCGFVWRLDASLRSAADSVHDIAGSVSSMRDNAAVITPGVEAMNHNLYRVAMHLGQLGEATENLAEGTGS